MLLKRFIIDLIAILVYNIKKVFTCKKVATLIIIDIQGIFNIIIYNRLIL